MADPPLPSKGHLLVLEWNHRCRSGCDTWRRHRPSNGNGLKSNGYRLFFLYAARLQMNGQTALVAPSLYAENLSVPCADLFLLACTASYPRNGYQIPPNDLPSVESLAFLYLHHHSNSMLCGWVSQIKRKLFSYVIAISNRLNLHTRVVWYMLQINLSNLIIR